MLLGWIIFGFVIICLNRVISITIRPVAKQYCLQSNLKVHRHSPHQLQCHRRVKLASIRPRLEACSWRLTEEFTHTGVSLVPICEHQNIIQVIYLRPYPHFQFLYAPRMVFNNFVLSEMPTQMST